MIVFEMRFARLSTVLGFVLWAVIAGLYGHAVFDLMRDEIESRERAIQIEATQVDLTGISLQVEMLTLVVEEAFETTAQVAFGIHVAVGVLVALQAVFFGTGEEKGVLSVLRVPGFLLQVVIITAAVFVNLFFFVSSFVVYAIDSTIGSYLLSGAILSFAANALMVTMWQGMLWDQFYNRMVSTGSLM